ncbi:MAG: heavy metal transport/detoxification protein [Neobacillus sp.]|nr:heavy metal transport/detoxification protein [Neobacillus sp.]
MVRKVKKKILVEGMKCENCAKHVKEALSSVEGVLSADVNLADKIVIIETSSDLRNESIKHAVNNEKYKVLGIEDL